MRGFRAFFAKELSETVHTWRLWVVPGFVLFAAISSPLLTYLMPTLLDSLGSAQQGLTITLGTPTAADAYLEYLGNLGELVLFALVIAYGGIVSGELRSGTGALALAKPLSRTAFVLTKWLSQALVVVIAGVVGTAACLGLTASLFAAGPAVELVAAALLWIAFALMLLAAMTLLSVLFPSPVAASGAGIAVYAALLVLGQFDVTSRFGPSGLTTAGTALVHGEAATWVAPLLTAAAVTAICLAAAIWRFARREI